MDWLGSFHPPELPTEEFEKNKAEYTAKHGYTVHVPSFKDIFIFKREPTLTPQEESDWKAKKKENFSEARLQEISGMKARRKKKFLQMMESPSPHYIRAAGSIMCALDDAQDCLNTVGVGCAVAGVAVPSPATPLLAATAGFCLTTGACIDAVGFFIGLASGARLPKRDMKTFTDQNPFSKKAKLKRLIKIKKGIPSFGDALQAAQVTRDVFGYGLCLGPIVGFAQDAASGLVRMAMGQKVSWKADLPPIASYAKTALRMMKGAPIVAQESGYRSLDSDMPGYYALNLAAQISGTLSSRWNPADMVEKLDGVQVEAPRPTNILTLECFSEEGLDADQHIGWPNVEKRWATYDDIYLAERLPATKGFNAFCQKEKHSQAGWLGAQCATQAFFQTLGNVEGDDAVEYDFIAAQRAQTRLLDAGLAIPSNISTTARSGLELYLNDHDRFGTCPTAYELNRFCRNILHFELIKIPKYAN